MGAAPTVDAQAFDEWPRRLRVAGYEVEVKAHDEEIGVGVARKGRLRLAVSLLRSKSGSTAVLTSGWCRRSREFLEEIAAAMETPLP